MGTSIFPVGMCLGGRANNAAGQRSSAGRVHWVVEAIAYICRRPCDHMIACKSKTDPRQIVLDSPGRG